MREHRQFIDRFSKTDFPKADVTKVLAPYSERMKTLLKNPSAFYTPKERPSGHDIAEAFGTDNGGAIPAIHQNEGRLCELPLRGAFRPLHRMGEAKPETSVPFWHSPAPIRYFDTTAGRAASRRA
jgi:hypothetical protein